MRTVTALAGAPLPVIGQGTWRFGESPSRRDAEVKALRRGFDLGMTLVDTAEMYANGGAERVVGEAIRGARAGIFLVSKVLPQNATRKGTVEAAERSLKRLRTDVIDLYLLHWEGGHPIEGTLAGFHDLIESGKIRFWGVSNFDVGLVERTLSEEHGVSMAANQVLYNLTRRGVERRLLPLCRRADVLVMAYSPLEQGKLPRGKALSAVARRHGVSPATVAIAWTVQEGGIVSIPKAGKTQHLAENAAAGDLLLDPDDLRILDEEFPLPARDIPLEMI